MNVCLVPRSRYFATVNRSGVTCSLGYVNQNRLMVNVWEKAKLGNVSPRFLVGLIIGVQMISFVPSFCLNIVQALSLISMNLLIHDIFPFAEAAAFMNAVLDPVIYFWRNREAGRSLKELRPRLQAKNTSVLHLTSFGESVPGH